MSDLGKRIWAASGKKLPPEPGGTVRVILDGESFGEPATFRTYDEWPVLPTANSVFDVPLEQYGRWVTARAAWQAMQEEIEALIEARHRGATTAGHSSHSATP